MKKVPLFSYENLVILLMGLAFGFVFFDRLAISFLAPFLVPELGLNNTQLGVLASALALTWAISGYGVGVLSDYLGNRKTLLVIAIVVFSACSILSGLATSFLMLLGARLLMGFAEGPVLPIAQSIMAAESSEHRRGFNMGVLQNFISSLLSNFAAPLILVAVGVAYGWREAFYIAGIPGFIVAILIMFFIREPARKEALSGSEHSGATISFGKMIGYRNIWICAIVSCLMVSWLLIQLTFLPIYLVQTRGVSPESMSVALGALGIAGALSSIIVPALSDRYGRRPILALFALVGVISPVTTVLFTGPYPAMVLVMGVGFLAIGCFSLFMATVPSETIPASYVATALGFIMGLGEIIGGVAGPTLAGMAADAFGPATPMWMAAVLGFAAALFCLMLDETAPRVVAKTHPIEVSSPA
ncbi:MAG TPA: MFS transporter [Bradyrhizobium sp.]